MESSVEKHGLVNSRKTARVRSRKTFAIASVTVGAVALAGCGGSTTGAGSSQGTSAANATPVKIGFIGELTGADQLYSVPMYNAMKLAIKKIGAFTVGGKQYRFQLVAKDDQTNESRAEAVATEFVNQDGIKFVYGATSYLAGPIVNITDAAHAIFLTPSTVAAKNLGTPEGKYLFATLPAFQRKINALTGGIQQFFPNAKSVEFLGPQTDITSSLIQAAQPKLQAAGIKVATTLYQHGTTAYSSILTEASRSGSKVLVLTGSVPTDTSFIKENNQLQAFSGVLGWGMSCTQGQAAGNPKVFVGIPGGGPSLVHATTPAAKAFVAAYSKAFGSPGSNVYSATWTYDYVFMLEQAMQKAGTVSNTATIANALTKVHVDGLLGPLSFDSNHAPVFNVVDCEYKDGKFTYRSSS